MDHSDREIEKNSRNWKRIFGVLLVGFGVTGGALFGVSKLMDSNENNKEMTANFSACGKTCVFGKPVCGSDRIWYANECMAACANIKPASSPLLCGTSPKVNLPSSLPDTVLERHAEKGYRYVGHLLENDDEESIIPSENFSNSKFNPESADSSSSANLRSPSRLDVDSDVVGLWMLLDEDGAAYVRHETRLTPEQAAATSGYLPGSASGCPGGQDVVTGRVKATKPVGFEPSWSPASEPAIWSAPRPAYASSTEGGDVQESPVAEAHEVPASADSKSSQVKGRKKRRSLAVIGADSRTQIHTTTETPVKYVGQLLPVGCTGTLIGPSHVITAAHCLWGRNSPGGGKWMNVNDFMLGRTRTDYTSHRASAKILRKIVHMKYRSLSEDEFQWDYGLVVLDTPLGAAHGWMGVGFDCGDHVQKSSMSLQVAGYPADKPFGTMWQSRCDRIDSSMCHTPSVTHYCDTAGGMSGSSMFDPTSPVTPGDAPTVRAVHVAGNREMNIATLITPQVLKAIEEWRVDDACPLPANVAATAPPRPY